MANEKPKSDVTQGQPSPFEGPQAIPQGQGRQQRAGQATHQPGQLQPQRKQLFSLTTALDSGAVKAELDGLLHAAEGVALVIGQTGINRSLAFAQTLVDNDDLRDVVVADVNAWLGLGEPTVSVAAPRQLTDEAKEMLG